MTSYSHFIAVKGGKGPATSLFVDEIPKPTAAAGQAIIKIHAFGLNRMDLLQREGKYPVPPQAPETIGVEFSGVVESVAAGSKDDFKAGDEVFGLAYGGKSSYHNYFLSFFILEDSRIDDDDDDDAIGAYAEYIAVSTKMLIHKPKDLSWEQAAGVPEVGSIYRC